MILIVLLDYFVVAVGTVKIVDNPNFGGISRFFLDFTREENSEKRKKKINEIHKEKKGLFFSETFSTVFLWIVC